MYLSKSACGCFLWLGYTNFLVKATFNNLLDEDIYLFNSVFISDLKIINADLQNMKSPNFKIAVKYRKRENVINDVKYINNNIEMIDNHKNINMLKRKLTPNETRIHKKQKKENITNSFVDNINQDECTKKFDKEMFQRFQNVETNKKDKGNEEDKEYLNGKLLRESLNSTNGLDMVRKFVKICSENREGDLAAEYLNAGGTIFEILKLLNTADKKGTGIDITVFSATRILLIKILTQYPQYHTSTEEACRYLINSHLSVIHAMLSKQSNAKQQKVVLQLLAAIVSFGGSLPRELLIHLSLSLEVVKSLVQHTKPTDDHNIRNCFIHFILAFLIEGNIPIIRTLLEKRNLLSSIFPDLIYDSKDIVVLILTTFKTYVLQNVNVSKTMKLQIFSTSVIQNLLCLYNWKGPNNWLKLKTQSSVVDPHFLLEKEVVCNVVHDFLLLLLTSHRYGIIFHDRMLGTSHVKHNHMINTILQSLDRPWEYEKPSNLLIKIMTACPDLIKPQFILLESYIAPEVSLKWIAVIKFIREIIQSVDIKICIKICSTELNILQLTNAIVSLTMPEVILKRAVVPSLTHSNVSIRHEAILTLISMLNQIQKYIADSKTVYNEDSDFNILKNFVIEFIVKNVPNLNMILNVWNCAFISNSIDDSIYKDNIVGPKKYEHLIAILNLLHIYNDVCPKLLDISFDMETEAFLDTLNKLEDISTTEFNVIKVKAIQFLVILYPYEFLSHKKMFNNALSFLISILNEETSSIALCVRVTIRTLLNVTGLFEGCSDHLDIWVNGFINLNDRKSVTKWFIRIIKETVQNIERYVNEIIKTEESIDQEMVHTDKLQNMFNELINKPAVYENLESNIFPMQRFTSISPLLCCMLHKFKEDLHPSILSYLSYILIHTLHYQVMPQCLIYLTKDIQKLPVKEYFLSWLDGNQVVSIKKIVPTMTLLCKINSVFLTNTKIQMDKIFNGNNVVTFHYNNESMIIHHSLVAYEIIYLFKMTTFYLLQFTRKHVLTKIQYDNYKTFLISLLYISKSNLNSSTLLEECAKSISTHPIVLHYFSPFHQENKSVSRSMITDIVIDVCNTIIDLCKEFNIRNLFVHFKNKLFMKLYKIMDKNQKNMTVNFDMIITLLEILKPSSKDVTYLLKRLMKLEDNMFISSNEKNLSIYGHLVPKLLKVTNSNEMKSERSVFFELDEKFVRDFCLHLLFLKSNLIRNFELWEATLHGYLLNFSFNIGGINESIFTSLLSTKITDTTVNLISFLIRRNVKFIPIFMKCMVKPENMKENGNNILQIVSSNLNFKWDQNLLENLRRYYEAEILSYLRNPKNAGPWIEENVIAISYLIETTFNFKTCDDTCNIILQARDKLDVVSINYIKLVQSIYNKAAALETESEKYIMNLIQVLLYIITVTLKKESKNIQKLRIICEILNNKIKYLKGKKNVFKFEELSTIHSWSRFTRISLKFGLDGLNCKEEVPVLKILSFLCDIAYKNDSNNAYVKTLFEMATSHSEFINIMLGSSNTKRDLVELLWILMQKNKVVMTLKHIPVYLAAYNATLAEADQYILFILQYYESNNINICEYRPYVWGNMAAVYYSIKGETHTTLWRQPSIIQVLNLFEENIVNNTIKKYPIDRALKSNEVFGASDVYDPAFYLPLLYFLLSENNVVPCHKVAQSGALALTLAACSSTHREVRMIAYTIITRYYSHLEASSSKSKLLWMRLIDALRYGIVSLQLELNDARLNCMVSTFLARTSLIAIQPLNPLYSALQMFLMAKPALDINTIPELLQFLHSSDVQYITYRHWILANIRDSMRTEIELDIAFKCVLFKMLFDFYISTLPDLHTKKLILEILDATLKIKKAPMLFIENYGLFPWLLEVTRNLQQHEVEHTELVVKIMDKLLNSVLYIKGDIIPYKLMLLNVALCLKSHIVKDISIKIFTLYINILQKLILSKSIKILVTKECISEILEFSKKMLDSLEECDDMLRFGCKYVIKADCLEDDNEIEIARNSLRTLVWTWCIHEAN